MEKGCLKFTYVNWKGKEYEYVVEVEGFTFSDYPPGEPPKRWQMHGILITRDGDPRKELPDHPRRSFLVTKMRNMEEVEHPNRGK